MGPVIVSREVPIFSIDTCESLEERVHRVEHGLFVQALKQMIECAALGQHGVATAYPVGSDQ